MSVNAWRLAFNPKKNLSILWTFWTKPEIVSEHFNSPDMNESAPLGYFLLDNTD
jgi:hypothetical protein